MQENERKYHQTEGRSQLLNTSFVALVSESYQNFRGQKKKAFYYTLCISCSTIPILKPWNSTNN